MLQAYSTNVTVAANTSIPFNSVTVEKGCTTNLSSPTTIQLNKCGVYMVTCDVSATTATTIQLRRDGVLLPQAQSTGNSPSFTALIQVQHDNCKCNCCESPTILQVVNTVAGTLTDANIVVTKLC